MWDVQSGNKNKHNNNNNLKWTIWETEKQNFLQIYTVESKIVIWIQLMPPDIWLPYQILTQSLPDMT